jgi:CRP-like cAMP-binding protein
LVSKSHRPRHAERSERQLHRNQLLAALPARAFDFLAEKLIPTTLAFGEVLYEQHQPLSETIFPYEGVVAIVTVMSDGRSAETATIGPEGYVGFTALLGERTAIQRYVVQVPGTGARLPLETLDELVERHPEVLALLLRYSKSLLAQTLQMVACNSLHNAGQRCCRWLLMTHDRVKADTFAVKQEDLARLLGVRRATVGETCAELQEDGIIRYSRGTMTILDRSRLGRAACECYGAVRHSYQRLLPITYKAKPARSSALQKRV